VTVGFVGLSHLGLNYSLATAAKGFDVVAYDPDEALAARCQAGDFPIEEPGFMELFAPHRVRLRYTSDRARLSACDLVFYALDVKTDDRNQSDLGPLDQIILDTAASLSGSASAVILSQVSPGYTRKLIADLALRPEVKATSFFYQVETLIFGAAVQRAMQPERYIVGAPAANHPLPQGLRDWHAAFGCPVLVMRFESAELAKISINMCLVASVTTANTLAELCEEIGADWSEIVPALRLDKRIGQFSYLAPGLGIAGGNLERDLVTVCNLADEYGTDAGVVRAWIANSYHRRDWALRTLWSTVLSKIEDPVIAVLGLAYKQDTHSTKNSPSIALLEHLKPFRVRVFDPVVPPSAAPNPRCHPAKSELEACEGADAVAIMTPWGQFAKLDVAQIARKLRGRTVLDPYALLEPAACRAAGLQHLTLGAQP
jgi:UDPglucose 6-dehydrogenase